MSIVTAVAVGAAIGVVVGACAYVTVCMVGVGDGPTFPY